MLVLGDDCIIVEPPGLPLIDFVGHTEAVGETDEIAVAGPEKRKWLDWKRWKELLYCIDSRTSSGPTNQWDQRLVRKSCNY